MQGLHHILAAGITSGPAGWMLWPLWWLLPIMALRFGWWRRRQWN
jgi:hypothetical protein